MRPLKTYFAFLIMGLACAHNIFAQDEEILKQESELLGNEVSLSLPEALKMALESNLDVAIGRITPAIEETNILSERDAFDPSLDISLDYGENSSPRSAEQQAADGRASTKSRTATGQVSVSQKTSLGTELSLSSRTRDRMTTFNDFEDEFSTFVGVEATQPLLKGFGTDNNLASIRIAEKGKIIAEAEFQNQVETIIQDVFFAYYDLLFSSADVISKKKSMELAERLSRDNKKRYELGAMTKLDISNADAEIAGRKNAVVEAEEIVQLNENKLLRLITRDMGIWLQNELDLTDTLNEPGKEIPQNYDIAVGLANRSDYQALLHRADQNELRLAFQKQQLLPQLDLTTSFGYNGLSDDLGESYKNISETRDEDWNVGFRFIIPWGNYREKARFREAELLKARTILEIKNKEQDVIEEIDNALISLNSSKKKLVASRTARRFAEENAAAEEVKLTEGSSTTFVVLELQQDAQEAETTELRNLREFNKALVRLKRAQGLLLKENGITILSD
ncbi:MAG: TolC family protein [Verrucomicrobiota bacterium]